MCMGYIMIKSYFLFWVVLYKTNKEVYLIKVIII